MNSMEKIQLLPLGERKYIQQLFKNCTKEVLENMTVMKIEKESNFIVAGEKCRNIFIILNGRARGIDMQIQGKVYTFKEFGPGRVLGEFECLSGIPEYSITIRTITDCTFWVIPSAMYLRWMGKDGDALFLRVQRLLEELTYQTMENRKNLLLNCSDRLILYFLEQYERHHIDKGVTIRKSRDEIANTVGFCVKTINRNIKSLQAQNYIAVKAGKVCISDEQYEEMLEYTQKKLL